MPNSNRGKGLGPKMNILCLNLLKYRKVFALQHFENSGRHKDARYNRVKSFQFCVETSEEFGEARLDPP